jgi:hypothetical protein
MPADLPDCLPVCLPAPFSLSPPPSLFPDKKFPVEAHFWLDELFYYIDFVFKKNFFCLKMVVVNFVLEDRKYCFEI